jgi:RND family efflux transporter MFP subunit
VSAAVPGVLEALEVERGDVVRRGQVLGNLDATVERAMVELAEARATMDAALRSREADLEFAEKRRTRNAELFRANTLSAQENEDAEREVVLAELALRRVRQEMQLAELELGRARANLELRTIESPIDGVVVERLVSPGESVEDRPILEIAKVDPLNVEVIVPVSLLGSIRRGMRAEVRPEAPVGGVHEAEVSIVDRVVDAASGTFGVRLTLPNPGYELVGGLRCTVRFPLEPGPAAGARGS